VVVAGLEDGLLPHFNSQGAREDIEEERRLFYVGMTRARERLYITCCRRRRIAGRYQDQMESPFLSELPPELLEQRQSPSLYIPESRYEPRAQDVYSFFDQGRPAAPRPASPPPVAPAPSAPRRPAGSPSYGRERTVVPEPQEIPRRPIRRGSRVRHPTLGQGVVLELEGQGEEAKITVFFEKSGKRKLVARFANLEML
jgi:DNA helicase-2/ATP-dependent DNA helicase PcrA